jgi:hypothetical protein
LRLRHPDDGRDWGLEAPPSEDFAAVAVRLGWSAALAYPAFEAGEAGSAG